MSKNSIYHNILYRYREKKRLLWINWLQLTLTASFDWLDCDPHGCVLCQFKIILMTEKLFCLFINVKHPFTSCMCPFLEKTKISKLNESWSIFVCYRRMVDGHHTAMLSYGWNPQRYSIVMHWKTCWKQKRVCCKLEMKILPDTEKKLKTKFDC